MQKSCHSDESYGTIFINLNFYFLHLHLILKGLSGDADHVADADRLEQSGVGEFIRRSAADTENDCDVIHSVCSALGRPFFIGAHKMILPC